MRKPRVVLDTNVLISAIIFGGPPRKILQMIFTGSITGCLSMPILEEMIAVLRRRKFGFSAEQSMHIMEELHGLCEMVSPDSEMNAVPQDPDDNRILECALAARADFIISGDSHLTAMGQFNGIPIMPPSMFIDIFEK